MQYCKYHPLQAATYQCPHCNTDYCDQCIDLERSSAPRCFHCQRTLESLGASNSATPFWRRLEQSFQYPLNKETGVFLVVVSFLTSVLGYAPLGFLWVLMISGAFFKYSMVCLNKTAQGDMAPPSINSAYGDGLSLLFQLLLILGVMTAVTVGAYVYLGSAIGGLYGTIMVITLPAVIINFAITENVWEALNPHSAVRIIKTVGLPYGILMAFILIMLSSVGVINSFLGDDPSVLLATIQSLVSNYYTLVVFHIMGYMIFQYQHEFGFYARHSDANNLPQPTARERLSAKIDVTLKEGDFTEVLKLYSKGVRKYPDDTELFNAAFNFICGIKDQKNIGNFSDAYFLHLKSSNRLEMIRSVYQRTLLLDSNYTPNSPLARHLVAKACFDCGDYSRAVKLLNGLHKQHPEYFDLANAYVLMAHALEQLPKLAANADQYRRLAENIKRQPKPQKQKTVKKSAQRPAKIKNNQVDVPSAVDTDTESLKAPASPLEKTQKELNTERRAKAKLVAAERQQNEQEQIFELSPTDKLETPENNPAAAANKRLPKPKTEKTLEEIFSARTSPDKDSDIFDFSEPENAPKDDDGPETDMPPIKY